jgi:cytoskeletal protein RodZ
MKTVGELIREARVTKKISYEKIGAKTKIKKSFILAIERNDWGALPDYPVVVGFVKSLASSLGLDPATMAANLRRDYPPKKVAVNPKPDVQSKPVWGPKMTFILGVSLVLMVIISYVGYQYYRFVSPPRLELFQPQENQVIVESKISVGGKVDQDSTVTVNNQPAIVDGEGIFSTELTVDNETKEIVLVAKSRAGKETVFHLPITVELKN